MRFPPTLRVTRPIYCVQRCTFQRAFTPLVATLSYHFYSHEVVSRYREVGKITYQIFDQTFKLPTGCTSIYIKKNMHLHHKKILKKHTVAKVLKG